MQFQEFANIDTPEGVQLELTLAGLGTRMIAQFVDSLVKAGVALVLLLVIGTQVSFIFWVTMLPVLFFGYEIVFETLWAGRTPGKRLSHIRVVRADGSAITFTNAIVRNLMRLVDILPGTYGVGAVLVFTTKNHQRLGDLAAGTIVVREPLKVEHLPAVRLDRVQVPPGFDATMVTQDQVGLARSFLIRRASLDPGHRQRLALQIAQQLKRSIVDPSGSLSGERLVEVVVAVKTASGRS